MKLLFLTDDTPLRQRWSASGNAYSVSSASSLEETRAVVAKGANGICLADLAMEGLDRAALTELITRHPNWFFVAMSPAPDDAEGLTLLKSGARGYANRLMNPALLDNVIGLVASGEIWAGQRLVAYLLRTMNATAPAAENAGLPSGLTDREKELTALVVRGASNKEIARLLNITERTVKAHLGTIFKKTGTRTRVQLAVLAKDQVDRPAQVSIA